MPNSVHINNYAEHTKKVARGKPLLWSTTIAEPTGCTNQDGHNIAGASGLNSTIATEHDQKCHIYSETACIVSLDTS